MKHVVGVTLFCGVLSALIVCGAASPSAQGYMLPKEAVTVADKVWREAYVACDVETWDKLLGGDLVFIHIGGMVDDKAKQMASVERCDVKALETQVTSVRVYGDTVVLLGAMQGKAGGDFGFDIVYTRVYVQQEGVWKLVSHQSTDVSG